MNLMFWILIILFCIFLWFVLAFLFRPIGKLFYRIYKDAVDEIADEETELVKELETTKEDQ